MRAQATSVRAYAAEFDCATIIALTRAVLAFFQPSSKVCPVVLSHPSSYSPSSTGQKHFKKILYLKNFEKAVALSPPVCVIIRLAIFHC